MSKIDAPFELTVNAQSFAILRRLDADGDGTIREPEAVKALQEAGTTRARNEGAGLTPAEMDTVKAFDRQGEQSIRLFFGDDRRPVGKGEGRVSWDQVHQTLAQQSASQPAPLGTVGQERPGELRNSDCGPAAALFMNDLRIRKATGHEPARTQGEADALLTERSLDRGTMGLEISRIMDKHFARVGDQLYVHDSHPTSKETLVDQLREGLEKDPGGVMVSIVSTYNEAARNGTSHWIVVTGMQNGNVSYYEPGGLDGAKHHMSMPVDELLDSLAAPLSGQRVVVYGQAIPEAEAKGELPRFRLIGAMDTWAGERGVRVTGHHGVYGSQEKAEAAAQALAKGGEQDAVVRQEANGFAVYSVDELADKEGLLFSSNKLVGLDEKIVHVQRSE